MSEAQLIKKIREFLKKQPECFFWKEHGGQYGTTGIPDVIVCYKGRFVAFEAKVGKNTTTKLQDYTIEEIRKAGGIAEVVRSVEEVERTLQKVEVTYGDSTL